MNKIILKNNYEIEIHEGCSLWDLTVDLQDYEALVALSAQLTTENLQTVRFMADVPCIPEGEDEPAYEETVTDVYTDMQVKSPRFHVREKHEGGLEVVFGLEERSAIDLRLGEDEQQITDTQIALCEVYELLG